MFRTFFNLILHIYTYLMSSEEVNVRTYVHIYTYKYVHVCAFEGTYVCTYV